MNYLKVYCNLIRKAENRTPPEGYTEKHHTFPVSIFGKNNRIVVLTAKEHYIAHALLEKICNKRYGLKDKRTFKMKFAYNMMSNVGEYKNSVLYEYFKKRFFMNNAGENHPMYGKSHSEESRRKMSKAQKGKKKIPRSKEHIEKLRQANIGKKVPEEVRNKIKKSMLGKNVGSKSKETRDKISKSKKGCVSAFKGKYHTEETKNKLKNLKIKYEYTIISPFGVEYKTNNLKKFCKEYSKQYLSYPNMSKLCNNSGYNYKMWKVQRTLVLDFL